MPKLLFVDWRHVRSGQATWRKPDGSVQPRPPKGPDPVPLHAHEGDVPWGVRLEAQPAEKSEPYGPLRTFLDILHDGGMYRTWHFEVDGHSLLGNHSPIRALEAGQVDVCALESRDGWNWKEAARCTVATPGQYYFDGLTVFIDPQAPPHERYKLVYSARVADGCLDDEFAAYLEKPEHERDGRLTKDYRFAMFALTSPDGLGWTPLENPLLFHASDTDTAVFWDVVRSRYVMYTRLYLNMRRWIARTESPDFREWSPVEPVIGADLADPPTHDVYTNGFTMYPGEPGTSLMMPMVWKRLTERSEVRLMSSPDARRWSWVPGGPVIEPGSPGAWDSEYVYAGRHLVPFGADRLAVPYHGACYPHKYPRWPEVWSAMQVGWASWKRDRIAGVAAGEFGEFHTFGVVPSGGALRINCETPLGGVIQVGIDGVEGRAWQDCDPINGDHLDHAVTWGGDPALNTPEGQPISLHVRMRCAKLFSLTL